MNENQANPEMTFGQKAVGLTFNPSANPLVSTLKTEVASFIDSCNNLRATSSDPEVKRMASIAITAAQSAQVWAVKAATWN